MTIALKQFTRFPNAGDVASGVVVAHITKEAVEIIGEHDIRAPNLVAIGSILHWADAASVIWGTGLIASTAELQAPPRAVLACRGHLTRRRLQQMGIAVPDVVGDPGVFLPEIFPAAEPTCALGIVPHYVDRDAPFVARAEEAGALVIDPLLPLPAYVRLLTSCRAIASSSLHGLIFAHAYRIPAVWIRLSDRVIGDGFKFRDYYSAIGMDEFPVCGPDDPVTAVFDNCHQSRSPIDRESLRLALTGAMSHIRAAPEGR